MFQSRNRETFDFNTRKQYAINQTLEGFQSRNRETFDFNGREGKIKGLAKTALFQSRNRETFDFNETKLKAKEQPIGEVSIS